MPPDEINVSYCRGQYLSVLVFVQVIVAGSKEVVDKAMQRAERFREDLVARGVLLIPLVWKSGKEEFATKKGFGGQRKPAVTPVSGLVVPHFIVGTVLLRMHLTLYVSLGCID